MRVFFNFLLLLSIPNICQQDPGILSPSPTPYPHCHHLRSAWHHILFVLLEKSFLWKKKCYWNIVDLQCCVSFRCIAKWIRCVCVYACACAHTCSIMSNSATSWTVAQKASLSMEFPKQEYCSGLPFPTPGDLPDPGIKPLSLEIYIYIYISTLF